MVITIMEAEGLYVTGRKGGMRAGVTLGEVIAAGDIFKYFFQLFLFYFIYFFYHLCDVR